MQNLVFKTLVFADKSNQCVKLLGSIVPLNSGNASNTQKGV